MLCWPRQKKQEKQQPLLFTNPIFIIMKTKECPKADRKQWVVALMKLVEFIVSLVKKSKKSKKQTSKN